MPAPKTIAAILYWIRYFIAHNFGYSQSSDPKTGRWSGLQGGKAHEPGSFDCTSIIGAILYLAGYIPLSALKGTWYSGNLASQLEKYGYKRVSAKGKSLAWLRANVVGGAVLVGPGHGVIGAGGGKVLSWQYSETGGTTGKVGRQKGESTLIRDIYMRSRGWTDLLLPPVEAKPAVVSATVKVGTANCQSYDGDRSEKAWRARGQLMKAQGCQVWLVQETSDIGRKLMCAELGPSWRYYSNGKTVAVMVDTAKLKPGRKRVKSYGTAFGHGAVCMPVTPKGLKRGVDVICQHTRPGTVATSAQKDTDIRKGASLAGSWPTIYGGDFARDKPALTGWARRTKVTDSMDKQGIQTPDAIFTRGARLTAGAAAVVDPGRLSDHLWMTLVTTITS